MHFEPAPGEIGFTTKNKPSEIRDVEKLGFWMPHRVEAVVRVFNPLAVGHGTIVLERLPADRQGTIDSMDRGRSYFTEEEARRLLHRRVRSLLKLAGIPKGTAGIVSLVDVDGDGYSLGIEWDLSGQSRALVDWFSKDEFEEFLTEC